MKPLVSVIIPCFNGGAYVADAIRSALGQTYAAKEVIVVNDGSTDNSLTVISAFRDHIRIINQSNRGLSAARNRGIAESHGEWLAFLDADDWWDSRFIERSVDALRNGAVLSYCGWQNVGLPGGRGQPFVPDDYESYPTKIQAMVEGPKWPVHAAVVRRDAVNGIGGFDESLPCCEDFAVWIRLATQFPITRVPEVLAYYRFHSNQMTRNRGRIAIVHRRVQLEFLSEHPEIGALLGKDVVKAITHGALLGRGYDAYWARDLPTARAVFRALMRDGYGRPRNWLHMLPSILPEPMHRLILGISDRLRSRSPNLP